MYAYSQASMLVRCAIAAIDHNSNTDRSQAVTASGIPRYDVTKQRPGSKYHAKVIREAKNTIWRDSLASLVLKVCFLKRMYEI